MHLHITVLHEHPQGGGLDGFRCGRSNGFSTLMLSIEEKRPLLFLYARVGSIMTNI